MKYKYFPRGFICGFVVVMISSLWIITILGTLFGTAIPLVPLGMTILILAMHLVLFTIPRIEISGDQIVIIGPARTEKYFLMFWIVVLMSVPTYPMLLIIINNGFFYYFGLTVGVIYLIILIRLAWLFNSVRFCLSKNPESAIKIRNVNRRGLILEVDQTDYDLDLLFPKKRFIQICRQMGFQIE